MADCCTLVYIKYTNVTCAVYYMVTVRICLLLGFKDETLGNFSSIRIQKRSLTAVTL